MKRKFSIVYAWAVRVLTFFLPDIPLFMAFRGRLYSFVMASAGSNFQVTHSAILNSISELSVGKNVYFANGVSLLCGGGVFVDDDVLVGPGVVISSDNHTFEQDYGYRFGAIELGRVEVGRGSWLCANSVVVRGSCIPPRSVLGPCSVFTSSTLVSGEGIYSGNPAIFRQRKFSSVKGA